MLISTGWSSTHISPPKPLCSAQNETNQLSHGKKAAYKGCRWKTWKAPAACSEQMTNNDWPVSRINFCALGPAARACCPMVTESESLSLERLLRSLSPTINPTDQVGLLLLQHSLGTLCMKQPGWIPSSKPRNTPSVPAPKRTLSMELCVCIPS